MVAPGPWSTVSPVFRLLICLTILTAAAAAAAAAPATIMAFFLFLKLLVETF
jgi:hypothetical protein